MAISILYLPLEFNRYFSAKKFPYPLGIGMVEGFKDVQHITIPATYHADMWLKHVKDIVGDNKFDQVWLEVVHSQMSDEFLNWLTTIASVRVGFIVESLTIAPDEFISNSIGTRRRIDNMHQKLPYLTHIVVCDERDLKTFNKPTMLGITSIPERFIKQPSGTADNGIFYGTLYGTRQEWVSALEHKLTINPSSAEDETIFPQMFDELFGRQQSNYDKFYKNWFEIRQSVYSVWINHLNKLDGCCFLNLPHRTDILSSRVIEGMAAGKPTISPKMNNNVDLLFTHNEDILYYNDYIEVLDFMDELINDSDFRFSIAENARANLLENHTTKIRVEEILKFTGV